MEDPAREQRYLCLKLFDSAFIILRILPAIVQRQLSVLYTGGGADA